MGTHLDIDDACAGHPQAQAELYTLRARVAELEATLQEMSHRADDATLAGVGIIEQRDRYREALVHLRSNIAHMTDDAAVYYIDCQLNP